MQHELYHLIIYVTVEMLIWSIFFIKMYLFILYSLPLGWKIKKKIICNRVNISFCCYLKDLDVKIHKMKKKKPVVGSTKE